MSTTAFPRVLGALTMTYGAYTFLRPASLLRAAGLESAADGGTSSGQALGRLVGARDVLSGLTMVATPTGAALRSAVVARVACDLSDVIGIGGATSGRSRVKVLAVSGLWGAVCASSLLATRGAR